MATIQLNLGIGTGGVAVAQMILQSTVNWGEESNTVIDYALTNQNSPNNLLPFTLSTGSTTFNSTNCPALPNAGAVWIIPSPLNGSSLTLKGASGDTGIPLNLTCPFFWPFPASPPTSFILTASGTANIVLAFV